MGWKENLFGPANRLMGKGTERNSVVANKLMALFYAATDDIKIVVCFCNFLIYFNKKFVSLLI